MLSFSKHCIKLTVQCSIKYGFDYQQDIEFRNFLKSLNVYQLTDVLQSLLEEDKK